MLPVPELYISIHVFICSSGTDVRNVYLPIQQKKVVVNPIKTTRMIMSTSIISSSSSFSIREIVTHGGLFHADDCFAVAALKLLAPEAQVIRTRDSKLTSPAEGRVIVDVGGIYNPASNQFDHHQKEGRKAPRSNGIPYSGFGLVWDAFGVQLCGDKLPELVHAEVDRGIVSGVDASDNGFAISVLKPEYQASPVGLGLSAAIAALNPNWMDKGGFDAAFDKAVALATTILLAQIKSAQGLVLARDGVRAALDAREHQELLILPHFMPWQETAVLDNNVLFCIFESEEGTWMVQAVPTSPASFAQRKPLPADWAGLRDAAFAKITGLPDVIFCHPGRFICGARSKASALALAKKALA